MANTSFYRRKIAKQPFFDFMIQHDDFYINTHGVSVTDINRAHTKLIDGLFHVLNKNSQPIVYSSLTVSSIRFRNENAIPATTLKISFNKTTYSADNLYRFDTYNVLFRSNIIGILTIRTKTKFENNNNVVLTPFQSIEFGASYAVSNVNLLDVQYYGASNVQPDKRTGTIDINLTIKSFTDLEMTNAVYETMTLTVNVINTGYVAAALQNQTY